MQPGPSRRGAQAATGTHRSGTFPGAEVYPYVVTTYRLTEHFTAGGMSRWLPYLAELQPRLFVEVSPELAAERRLENAGWATIVTARGAIEARVLVTDRMTPLTVGGRTMHQIGMPYHWGPNGLTTGDAFNELSSISLDPNVHIQEVKALAADINPGRRPRGAGAARATSKASRSGPASPPPPVRRPECPTSTSAPCCTGSSRTWPRTAGHVDAPPRMGFFTDTSICIGCKACEVACKEWNARPRGRHQLHRDVLRQHRRARRRHLAPREFIEQPKPSATTSPDCGPLPRSTWACRACSARRGLGEDSATEFRWLMASDVCKHCTHAACLDVCPTGALFRTEFGTVVVQQDVCNGCGYCVPACPYGVIDKREDDGRVWKCTLCYDRLGEGQEPACAKACPTESIQFGAARRAEGTGPGPRSSSCTRAA